MIPTIIHQTWKNSSPPGKYNDYIETIKSAFPGWEYRLWTDEDNRNLIKSDFSWFLDTYDSYPYNINRADVIRYFYMLKYGGVYFDLDVELHKPFHELLNVGDCFLIDYTDQADYFTHRGWDLILELFFLAAKPSNPFIHKVVQCLKNSRNRDYSHAEDTIMEVMLRSGPGFLTNIYRSYGDKYDNIVILKNLIKNPKKNVPGEYVGIHRGDVTWCTDCTDFES